MSYLALDLSSRTGWAHWHPGMLRPEFGVLSFHRFNKSNIGPDLEKMRAFLSDRHKLLPIRVVFYEGPIKLPTDTLAWLRFIYGLAGQVDWWAHKVGIEGREVAIDDWRNHFVGFTKGGRDLLKAAAIDACRNRGWAPKTDDEAEALGVLDYGLHCWKVEVPWRDRALLQGAA